MSSGPVNGTTGLNLVIAALFAIHFAVLVTSPASFSRLREDLKPGPVSDGKVAGGVRDPKGGRPLCAGAAGAVSIQRQTAKEVVEKEKLEPAQCPGKAE